MEKHWTFIFISIALILSSCETHQTSSTLKDVENYIMERPDSALTVLEFMDHTELKTKHDRAYHALLHAMALDKNYIDVDDDSLASVALEYYSKYGPKKYEARSLYYLGIAYYYKKDYTKAILEFTKAAEVASKCDSLYLGMSKLAQADTYGRTYNDTEMLKCLNDALEIFKGIKMEYYQSVAMLSTARCYSNTKEYDKAESIFEDLEGLVNKYQNLEIEMLTDRAFMKMKQPDPDYKGAMALYDILEDKYALKYMTYRDYWAWAYAMTLAGQKMKAENLIAQLSKADTSVVASYWKYRIYKHEKNYPDAFRFIEKATDQHSAAVDTLLKQSLSIAQRDYYKIESEFNSYALANRSLIFAVTIAFILVMLLTVCMIAGRLIRNTKNEKEQLLGYIEETNRLFSLPTANGKDDTLRHKFVSLYKSRFETFSILCNQYLTYEGHEGAEKMMYRKVWSLIEDIRNDKVRRENFEKILDSELNNIMSNIRAEMPKFKEVDYTLFSYLIAGFDLTTISRLLDMSLNNVYAHKRRIRVKIERDHPTHASQFLEMIS